MSSNDQKRGVDKIWIRPDRIRDPVLDPIRDAIRDPLRSDLVRFRLCRRHKLKVVLGRLRSF